MARAPGATAAEAEIRALVDNWANAIGAKDVDGVMAHYAADSVTFDLATDIDRSRCAGPAGVVRHMAKRARLRDPRPHHLRGR